MVMVRKLKRILLGGDQRTSKAKKNILLSIGIKACSILVSLVLVPLTLGYLNKYEYGIWLTLSSTLMWINYFDIGLGNGLRNKLAEALADSDVKKGQVYISTTFALLTIIMVVFYLLYYVCHFFFSWNAILNISSNELSTNLDNLVLFVLLFFCLNFILKVIGNVYLAKQLSVVNDLMIFVANVCSCIIIYILTLTTEGDLAKVALVYSVSPVVVYLLAYPITFSYLYKDLAPKWSCINFRYSKSLLSLGGQFFIVQIACLIIFSTSNLFITQLCSPSEVTVYNIAFKYFSVITMAFIILITPFWSAATDAYARKDFAWIKRSVGMMMKFWALLEIVALIMLLVADYVYNVWVNLTIPFSLSILMFLYVSIVNWNNLFAYFLNGIGLVRTQLYSSVIASMLYIPLAIFLGHIWGMNGICLAMCIVLFLSSIVLPIQYRRIIYNIV